MAGAMAVVIGIRYLILTAAPGPSGAGGTPFVVAAHLMFLRPMGLLLLLASPTLSLAGLALARKAAFRLWMMKDDRPDPRHGEAAGRREDRGPRALPEPGRADVMMASAFGAPAAALARKEYLMAIRDPEVIIRMAMSTVLIVLPLFIEGGGVVEIGRYYIPIALALGGWFAVIIFTGNSLGSEGNRLWILRSSPMMGREFFMGKWLMAGSMTAMFLLTILVISLVLSPQNPTYVQLVVIYGLTVALAGTGIGIGVSSALPHFSTTEYGRPSMPALVVITILFFLALLPGLAMMMVPNWILGALADPTLLRFIGIMATLAVSLTFMALLMELGARSFEEQEISR
jgi:hypothetical protein